MKPTCMTLNCPVCQASHKAFFRSVPLVVILKCAKCQKIIVFYKDLMVIADVDLITKLKSATTIDEINVILQDTVRQRLLKDVNPISNDDVLNLAIELSNCESFNDVMKVIEGTSHE
ncbi:MAG: hypothetical protein Q7R33_06045 [Nitrosarchaeum sp.]|nr:hypothetical protein [Nitrosarchaeum sp.]